MFAGSDTLNDDLASVKFNEEEIKDLDRIYRDLALAVLCVRVKKANRQAKQDVEEEHEIEVISGFQRAGEEFIAKFIEATEPYLKEGDIDIQLSGHSLGGALAVQLGYYINMKLGKHFNCKVDWAVVTIGGAGFFNIEDNADVSEILDAPNRMLHFYRNNDFSRELTAFVGYRNPGTLILLENIANLTEPLAEFFLKLIELQESIPEVIGRVEAERENHSIAYYVKTLQSHFDSFLVDGIDLRTFDSKVRLVGFLVFCIGHFFLSKP